MDNPTKYRKSVNSSLWVPANALNAADKYTCSARNIAGVASKTTQVVLSGMSSPF